MLVGWSVGFLVVMVGRVGRAERLGRLVTAGWLVGRLGWLVLLAAESTNQPN